jgi:hypothetical protein
MKVGSLEEVEVIRLEGADYLMLLEDIP